MAHTSTIAEKLPTYHSSDKGNNKKLCDTTADGFSVRKNKDRRTITVKHSYSISPISTKRNVANDTQVKLLKDHPQHLPQLVISKGSSSSKGPADCSVERGDNHGDDDALKTGNNNNKQKCGGRNKYTHCESGQLGVETMNVTNTNPTNVSRDRCHVR